MPLNIAPIRKHSLKGFAEGWDDCYLLVRGVGEARRQEMITKLGDKTSDDPEAAETLRAFCIDVITGGIVISTNGDGTTEKVTVTAEDVADVVDALDFSWRQEVSATATGADRLKVMYR